MVAIETRYLGPTDKHGSRYKATAGSGSSRTISTDTALDDAANHQRAALALTQQLQWMFKGPLMGGSTKRGMVWVFERGEDRITSRENILGPQL